jgi:hypothetical protein
MKHLADYIYLHTQKINSSTNEINTKRVYKLFFSQVSFIFFFYIDIKNILKNNWQSYFQINFNLLIATFIAYLSLSSYPLSPISFIFIFQSHDLLFFYFTIIVDMYLKSHIYFDSFFS